MDAHRNAGHALFDKWIIQHNKLDVRTLARLRLKLWSPVQFECLKFALIG
jgi:hypothetical protein